MFKFINWVLHRIIKFRRLINHFATPRTKKNENINNVAKFTIEFGISKFKFSTTATPSSSSDSTGSYSYFQSTILNKPNCFRFKSYWIVPKSSAFNEEKTTYSSSIRLRSEFPGYY